MLTYLHTHTHTHTLIHDIFRLWFPNYSDLFNWRLSEMKTPLISLGWILLFKERVWISAGIMAADLKWKANVQKKKLLNALHLESKANFLIYRGRPFPLPHPGAQAPAGSMSPPAVDPQQRPWLSWGSTSSKLPRRKRTLPCPAKGEPSSSSHSLTPSIITRPATLQLQIFHNLFVSLKHHSSPPLPLVSPSEVCYRRQLQSKILNGKFKRNNL